MFPLPLFLEIVCGGRYRKASQLSKAEPVVCTITGLRGWQRETGIYGIYLLYLFHLIPVEMPDHCDGYREDMGEGEGHGLLFFERTAWHLENVLISPWVVWRNCVVCMESEDMWVFVDWVPLTKKNKHSLPPGTIYIPQSPIRHTQLWLHRPKSSQHPQEEQLEQRCCSHTPSHDAQTPRPQTNRIMMSPSTSLRYISQSLGSMPGDAITAPLIQWPCLLR